MSFHDDLIYGLIGCILAIGLGVWMAKKQARAFRGPAPQEGDADASCHGNLPEVTFSDYGDMRFLHLGTPAVQGSMKHSQPFDIHLDYVQRMMAWLLFVDLENVKHLHAMQLGLGAASLTKFCHHHLGMPTTAIELNPQVIATCRRWFNLPANSATLHVLQADAGDVVTQEIWHGKIDVLQIDLYDQDAERPVLDSVQFYQDCHRMLTPTGCMVVNVFGRMADAHESMQKIAAIFGTSSVWAFKPTTAGNTVVLAFGKPHVMHQATFASQALAIQNRWPLPAKKWLSSLAPTFN